MDRDTLIKKAKKHLQDEPLDNNCCEKHIIDWIDAVLLFRQKTMKLCCKKTLGSLQHFIISESYDSSHLDRDNSIFGDLKEVRNKGFEARFVYNVKIHATYLKAYQVTEKEYESNFGKRRYASYDSFRQVRSRRIKKKNKKEE